MSKAQGHTGYQCVSLIYGIRETKLNRCPQVYEHVSGMLMPSVQDLMLISTTDPSPVLVLWFFDSRGTSYTLFTLLRSG